MSILDLRDASPNPHPWGLEPLPDDPNHLLDNRFVIVLLVMLVLRLRRYFGQNMYTLALFHLPGTVLHELAHFITGMVMNAHPVGLTLWPRKSKDGKGYVLGAVRFQHLTWYNAFPTAMAPLLLIVVAYWVHSNFFYLMPYTPMTSLAHLLLIGILIENSIPSPVDFRIAFMSAQGTTIYGGSIAALVMAWIWWG